MKKKILIIGPNSNSWGGVATCSKVIEQSNIMNDSFSFTHLTTWDDGKWIFSFIKALFKIRKLSKETDLIHINLNKRGSTYRILLLSLFFNKTKYIIHIHNGRYGYFYNNCNVFIKKRIINLLENAEYIIFVSNYQKEETLSYINIQNNNIKVIYNGINITNSYPTNKDYLQVLYFGSILKTRNVDEFIELANTLSSEKIKFVLAGNGPIEKLDLKNIEYKGFVSKEEKENLLLESDVIFDHFSESFGLGLLEAMNHYVCPLVYPLGSIPEIIGDNKYGLLFNNKDELIEKLLYLNKNKNILNDYKLKAHERSLVFSNEKYINAFKDLYNKVLENE